MLIQRPICFLLINVHKDYHHLHERNQKTFKENANAKQALGHKQKYIHLILNLQTWWSWVHVYHFPTVYQIQQIINSNIISIITNIDGQIRFLALTINSISLSLLMPFSSFSKFHATFHAIKWWLWGVEESMYATIYGEEKSRIVYQ